MPQEKGRRNELGLIRERQEANAGTSRAAEPDGVAHAGPRRTSQRRKSSSAKETPARTRTAKQLAVPEVSSEYQGPLQPAGLRVRTV